MRRLVHHRDAGRCQAPGCRHAVFVDVHPIDPRADGGSNAPENLVTLCAAHHRAAHRGELAIRRTADGLAFSHADGSPYGARSALPGAADLNAAAFRALRALGFRESEARQALARTAARVGLSPSLEGLGADLTGPSSAAHPPRLGRKAA